MATPIPGTVPQPPVPVPVSHPHPHLNPSPGSQPQMQPLQINPALQELLDSLPHNSIPFILNEQSIPNSQPPQNNITITCPLHKLSYCESCGVDFNGLNYMHQFLRMAPAEAIPPPPNMAPPPQRAESIKQAKEAGNVSCYLAGFSSLLFSSLLFSSLLFLNFASPLHFGFYTASRMDEEWIRLPINRPVDRRRMNAGMKE